MQKANGYFLRATVYSSHYDDICEYLIYFLICLPAFVITKTLDLNSREFYCPWIFFHIKPFLPSIIVEPLNRVRRPFLKATVLVLSFMSECVRSEFIKP